MEGLEAEARITGVDVDIQYGYGPASYKVYADTDYGLIEFPCTKEFFDKIDIRNTNQKIKLEIKFLDSI